MTKYTSGVFVPALPIQSAEATATVSSLRALTALYSLKILALDTSTEYCSAALWIDGEVRQRLEHAGQRHSQLLLPMVDGLLDESGLSLRGIDVVAAAIGPGSFTGLRIATAVGQGLAFGADLPVIPVGTLDALACASQAERVATALDARMGELYFAAFRRVPHGTETVVAPMLVSPESLPDLPGGDWLGCGNGFDRLGARIAQRLPAVLVQMDCHPEARHVAAIAATRFSAGERYPAEALVPMYVRDKVALTMAER